VHSLAQKAAIIFPILRQRPGIFAPALTATIGSADEDLIKAPISSPEPSQTSSQQNPPSEVSVSNRVDKSLLVLPEPRRFRDKSHCKFASKQPRLICGRQPADAHHFGSRSIERSAAR